MELFPYVQLSNLVATKEDAANRGVADGYAALDSNGRVPLSQIPTDVTGLINTVQLKSEKDQANGYAALDAARRIATNRLPANVGTVAADWPTYKPRIPPPGGDKDMVLTKSSSTDYAYTWQLPPGAQDFTEMREDIAQTEEDITQAEEDIAAATGEIVTLQTRLAGLSFVLTTDYDAIVDPDPWTVYIEVVELPEV